MAETPHLLISNPSQLDLVEQHFQSRVYILAENPYLPPPHHFWEDPYFFPKELIFEASDVVASKAAGGLGALYVPQGGFEFFLFKHLQNG